MQTHSTAKQRVEFGLDSIPEVRTVNVPLRDLVYVYQTLQEFMQFFHQPMHHRTLQNVHNFLGTAGSGEAFDVLAESLYERMRDKIPSDISDSFDDGERFSHPLPPSYYLRNADDKP